MPSRPLAPSVSVLDSVAALVDKSLLRQEVGPGDEPRLVMLETIREFGLERLRAHDEEAATRAAHAAWATEVAVRAASALERRLEPEVMSRVGAERANLRAALTWLAETNQTDDLLRLAGAVFWPWYLSGHLREGRDWAERALAAAPLTPTADRAAVVFAAGHLAHYLGDDAAAVARLEEAAAFARAAGDARREAFSTLLLGIVAEDAGGYARATLLFEAARETYARADDPRGIAMATFHLGVVAYGEGRPIRAMALQEEALASSRSLGDPLIEAWCLEWLGVLATERGELDQAATVLGARLAIGMIGSQPMHLDGQVMATVAVVGAACSAHPPAARLLGATDALLATSGDSFRLPERAIYGRAADRLRNALGIEAYERLAAVGRVMPDEAVTADMRAILDAAASGSPS